MPDQNFPHSTETPSQKGCACCTEKDSLIDHLNVCIKQQCGHIEMLHKEREAYRVAVDITAKPCKHPRLPLLDYSDKEIGTYCPHCKVID